MSRQDLVHYVQQCQNKGHSDEAIKNQLLQNNISKQEVNELFPPKKEKNKSKILIIILIILVIGGSATALIFTTGPECGNGKIERGETTVTCCKDAGCSGNKKCGGDHCLAPVCDECERIEGDRCVPKICCSDKDCDDQKEETKDTCTGNPNYCLNKGISTCEDNDNYCPLKCNYTNDNDCIDPNECKTHNDCNDNNPRTQDICDGEPRACSYENILLCIDDDNYCSISCTHQNDNDCAIKDLCVDDHDCVDGDLSTKDECVRNPKRCEHQIILFCQDNDSYCPPYCNITTDNNCKENTIQENENACMEDWTCNAWSNCIDKEQTRTCTDENDCSSTLNKPIENQACVEGQTMTHIHTTSNPISDTYISGNGITWLESSEVYYMNLNTQIIKNLDNSLSPKIYNNYIVYYKYSVNKYIESQVLKNSVWKSFEHYM